MIKFQTKDEEATAQELMKQGKATPFWALIVKVLEDSKRDIQEKQDSEDLSDLTPELYKLQNELFRSKKAFIDTLIDTPENIVNWLQQPDNARKNYDPYDTATDFEKS